MKRYEGWIDGHQLPWGAYGLDGMTPDGHRKAAKMAESASGHFGRQWRKCLLAGDSPAHVAESRQAQMLADSQRQLAYRLLASVQA